MTVFMAPFGILTSSIKVPIVVNIFFEFFLKDFMKEDFMPNVCSIMDRAVLSDDVDCSK
jgi:hypothetical protein